MRVGCVEALLCVHTIYGMESTHGTSSRHSDSVPRKRLSRLTRNCQPVVALLCSLLYAAHPP